MPTGVWEHVWWPVVVKNGTIGRQCPTVTVCMTPLDTVSAAMKSCGSTGLVALSVLATEEILSVSVCTVQSENPLSDELHSLWAAVEMLCELSKPNETPMLLLIGRHSLALSRNLSLIHI